MNKEDCIKIQNLIDEVVDRDLCVIFDRGREIVDEVLSEYEDFELAIFAVHQYLSLMGARISATARLAENKIGIDKDSFISVENIYKKSVGEIDETFNYYGLIQKMFEKKEES
jgi:hypothetical protein